MRHPVHQLYIVHLLIYTLTWFLLWFPRYTSRRRVLDSARGGGENSQLLSDETDQAGAVRPLPVH